MADHHRQGRLCAEHGSDERVDGRRATELLARRTRQGDRAMVIGRSGYCRRRQQCGGKKQRGKRGASSALRKGTRAIRIARVLRVHGTIVTAEDVVDAATSRAGHKAGRDHRTRE